MTQTEAAANALFAAYDDVRRLRPDARAYFERFETPSERVLPSEPQEFLRVVLICRGETIP